MHFFTLYFGSLLLRKTKSLALGLETGASVEIACPAVETLSSEADFDAQMT